MLSPRAGRAGTMVPLAPYSEDVVGKGLVVGAYIFMILSNALSFTGIFGSNIGDISKDFPTYVTPDGLTFSIWGVIYLLELVLTVAQCCASPDIEMLFCSGARYRIALAFVLNGLWLPLYSAQLFALALVIILAYLVVLVSVILVLNAWTVSNMAQWLLYSVPISANASWLVVASAANLFTLAGEYGWKDQFGVAGTVPAATAVVILATVLAVVLAVAMFDVAWSLVAAWALRGVWRMQTFTSEAFPPGAMNPVLATRANWAAAIAFLASLAGLVLALCMVLQRQIWSPAGKYEDVCLEPGRF